MVTNSSSDCKPCAARRAAPARYAPASQLRSDGPRAEYQWFRRADKCCDACPCSALHDAAEAGNASAIHGMLHLPAEGEVSTSRSDSTCQAVRGGSLCGDLNDHALFARAQEPARINPLAKLLFTAKDVLGCNPLHVAILRGASAHYPALTAPWG